MSVEIKEFKIENRYISFTPNWKRFSIPAIIYWSCPICGKENKYEPDYISFPDMNESFKLDLYCECSDEIEYFIKVKIVTKLERG